LLSLPWPARKRLEITDALIVGEAALPLEVHGPLVGQTHPNNAQGLD
jgi:hypothetical protein